jgi:hypothetical protein
MHETIRVYEDTKNTTLKASTRIQALECFQSKSTIVHRPLKKKNQ